MKKIFAANWKLHKTPQQTRDFFESFKSLNTTSDEVVFFPSAICLEAAATALQGSALKFGSQNCFSQAQGAFTGENSVEVVKELGGTYILVGHSERRSLFGETDLQIADKVQFIQSQGLTPMLCIGETLADREANKTFEVLAAQLKWGLSKANSSLPLVVAYEPVWAIGTGKVASAAQVAETHTAVVSIMAELKFMGIPLLYGGSVKAENAAELIKQPNVNGFLVGGASLEAKSFAELISKSQ